MHTRIALSNAELEALLREDVPYGDMTTAALGIVGRSGQIRFHARDAMIVCGIEEAGRLFELAGAHTELFAVSGDTVPAGVPLMSAGGPASALFQAWKVAQSLVESASGISSVAMRMVEQAGSATVACTRKHFPGIKPMVVKAVYAGGAVMHRLGLSETVMVTAEHRAFLDDEERASYLKRIHKRLPEKKCVVEVDTVADALLLVQQGCDVIQLEKLAPADVAQVVAAAHARGDGRTVVAAAGGINPGNVAEYAASGADVLVTSAPFFAGPRDVQVSFERE